MFPAFHARNHNVFLRMRVIVLIDRTTMMLLHRFNILNDIHKLRMVVVLVLGNWRIIHRLRWTIGTKVSFIHTTYIAHVIVTVHSNYPLPVLDYNLLYSQRGDATCTLDPEGDSLQCFRGLRGERITVYRLQLIQAAISIQSIGRFLNIRGNV